MFVNSPERVGSGIRVLNIGDEFDKVKDFTREAKLFFFITS